MAGETTITIIGNLTADPEVRTTNTGAQVANFTIASTPRTFNRNTNQWEDGQALFMRCSAWRELSEHIVNSLAKGMRVVAQGRLSQRQYQAQDGSNRTVVELTVDEIGPSLRYATARVTRENKNTGYNGQAGDNHPTQQYGRTNTTPVPPAQQDPWGSNVPTSQNQWSSPQITNTNTPAEGFGGDSDEPEF